MTKGRPSTWTAARSNPGEAVTAHSPDALEFVVTKPSVDSVKRTLLAWSLLAWCHYARYLYAASAGAALVRPLVLTPDTTLPTEILVSTGPIQPLGRPEPILILVA